MDLSLILGLKLFKEVPPYSHKNFIESSNFKKKNLKRGAAVAQNAKVSVFRRL